MPNGKERVLIDCFSLEEHPFDPQVDTRRKLDFRQRGVSLTRPLDVFNVEELKDYFVRTGPFKDALQQVNDYLVGSNYPTGGAYPPAFLIEGARGVGRSTMASFLGYEIKSRNAGKASFSTVTVQSEHFGKLLFTIRNFVKGHITRSGIPNCDEALNFYSNEDINPQDPSIDYLTQIFSQLGNCMVSAPPHILLIESITWQRREWMAQLYGHLKAPNIVLIFLTEDRRVFNSFKELRNGPNLSGVEVCLDALNRQMAEEFLTSRLANFRFAHTPADKTGLFPFADQILNQTFSAGQKMGIKLLESIFRGAFNTKLDELSGRYAQPGQGPNPPISSAELLIPFESVSKYYKATTFPPPKK